MGGSRQPQRGESRSLWAPKGAWKCEEWEKPEARIVITREIPLRAYASALPPHGPLELCPQTSGEVRVSRQV